MATPSRDESDLQALREALAEARHVLEHVCRYHGEWFDDELREGVQQACEEVAARWDIAADAITTERADAFEDAGLLGRQGAAKVRGIKRWAREFFRNPTKRAFMRAAKWINILLGSLATIVPGGEALKEFKELVEAAVADQSGGWGG
jgi:hypothetical protein